MGYELDLIANDLREISSHLDFDPEGQAEIEERLDLLYKITRKYGGNEEKCLEFLDKATNELNSITQSDEQRILFEKKLKSAKEVIAVNSERLTNSRKTAAAVLAKNICNTLKSLDMPNIRFVCDIKPTGYTLNGADKIDFLISTNAGEVPKPLAKIASGGELSRIMLAIKSALAEKDIVPTLIFDEIDTGISGRAAKKVAEKLRAVSKSRQVICVTHLAQIAAAADNHMLIEKSVALGRTHTTVKSITGDKRVNEIARIISGGEMTENLYVTAKELIESAIV